MAAPSSTPVFVIDTDYHESGRLATIAIVRLYDSSGVAAKVFVVADTDEQEDWLLTTLSVVFARNIQRMAGWDTHRTLMPKLLRRYFARAIPFPWYYQDRFGPRYRYSDTSHLDLKDFFSEYGMATGLASLYDAFLLVGDIQLTGTSCVLRTLAAAVLAARSDLVTGRIDRDMHDRTLKNLLDATVASLDGVLMEGRTEDALGIEFGPYWDESVKLAYELFRDGFHV